MTLRQHRSSNPKRIGPGSRLRVRKEDMQFVVMLVGWMLLASSAFCQASTRAPLFLIVSEGKPDTALIVYDDAAYMIDTDRSSYGSPVGCTERSMPLTAITTYPFSHAHEDLLPDMRLDKQSVVGHFESVEGNPEYDLEIVSDIDAGVACFYVAMPTDTPGAVRLKMLGGYSPTLRIEARSERFRSVLRWLHLDVLRRMRARESERAVRDPEKRLLASEQDSSVPE